MRKSVQMNSLSGICLTKLDVLDGLDKIGICTAYEIDGKQTDIAPLGAERYAACIPIIEEIEGWEGTTAGITEFEKLPKNAKAYVARIEELIGVKIDNISTGPDRNETIVLQQPIS
jgi:adenylosuccinate synthase